MCLNYQKCMLQLDDWDQIASITMQGVTVLANLSDLQADPLDLWISVAHTRSPDACLAHRPSIAS